jgi:hypothetical protein
VKSLTGADNLATLNFVNTISTASLRADWHGLQYRDGQLEQCDVEVTTLDALIAKYGIPAFCKIGVEGFEAEVLKGLSQPLRMLSLEYHRDEAGQALECLNILSKLVSLQINAIAISEFGGVALPEAGRCDHKARPVGAGEEPQEES